MVFNFIWSVFTVWVLLFIQRFESDACLIFWVWNLHKSCFSALCEVRAIFDKSKILLLWRINRIQFFFFDNYKVLTTIIIEISVVCSSLGIHYFRVWSTADLVWIFRDCIFWIVKLWPWMNRWRKTLWTPDRKNLFSWNTVNHIAIVYSLRYSLTIVDQYIYTHNYLLFNPMYSWYSLYVLMVLSPNILNIAPCTHDIPWCTEHHLYRVPLEAYHAPNLQ